MHRCLVQPEEWSNDRIRVSAGEAHRLLHVLRLRDGDRLSVFDGRGNDAVARLEVEAPETVYLRRVHAAAHALPAVDLTLIQAVPKGRRMDVVVEKGTELGVRTIAPVITARGVVRPEGAAAERRVARWQRIAAGAARQCGVSVVPRVEPLRTLPDALAHAARDGGVLLVGSLQHAARPFREVIRELQTRGREPIRIVIGPEGDFTDEELSLLASYGARQVSFGSLVLRVETAALFAASVVAYEFADSTAPTRPEAASGCANRRPEPGSPTGRAADPS